MKFISLVSVLFFSVISQASLQLSATHNAGGFQTESSSHSYNFGLVGVNNINTVGYTVTNTGTTFLKFSTASVWGAYYDANHSCLLGLQPQQSCTFQIRYWPFNTGFHSGQFEIIFFSPLQISESIRVSLWGEAIYR
jgi:hypothetical protein